MITATFTDGFSLVCEIPSKSKSGIYLVKVEAHEEKILVRHECPAEHYHQECTHVNEAVSCFHKWQPSSMSQPIVKQHEKITLLPEWEQIPVPGSNNGSREQVEAGDVYAT